MKTELAAVVLSAWTSGRRHFVHSVLLWVGGFGVLDSGMITTGAAAKEGDFASSLSFLS